MLALRTFFFSLILLCLNSCSSQHAQGPSALYTGWEEYYLHGPVQEVLTIEKRNFDAEQNVRYNPVTDIIYMNYFLFDSLGLMIRDKSTMDSISIAHFKAYPENGEELFLGPDFARLDTTLWGGGLYDYDDAGLTEKKNSIQPHEIPMRVYNPFKRKVNNSYSEVFRFKTRNDSSSWMRFTSYGYEEDSKGRLIESTVTVDVNRFDKRMQPWLSERIEFIYDEEERLTKQVYHFDEGASGEPLGRYSHLLQFGYPIMGPEFNTGDSVTVHYSYDELDRCRNLIVKDDSREALKHVYSYAESGWLKRMEVWVNPGYTYFSRMTYGDYCVFIFNSNGHPMKVTSYHSDGSVHRERLYDYEYDHHNNWIHCQMWLDGVREGEPQKDLRRHFNYFGE